MRHLITLLALLLPLSTWAQGTTPTFQVKTMADLISMPVPVVNNRLTALVTGSVTENDGGGGIFYYQTNSAAVSDGGTIVKPAAANGRWFREYSGAVNVKWFGAKGDGSTEDYPAILLAINAVSTNAGEVYFPRGHYKFSTTLNLPSNVTLSGEPPTDEVFGSVSATSLVYAGATSPAIQIKPPLGVYYETIGIKNLQIDGSGVGAGIDGVAFLGTNGGGAGVRGVSLENVVVKNFTRYQVWLNENIFHILFYNCLFENRSRVVGDDLVRVEGSAVGQVTYFHTWLSQNVVGHWAHYGAAHEVRFVSGTIEASQGANGVYVENSGIDIVGTHFESYGGSVTSIGIRYLGGIGGTILPSNVSLFGTGIQIGNPSSAISPAVGVIIGGGYTGNNVRDLHITAGGSRLGVVVNPSGNASGAGGAIVLNERFTVDGSMDVVRHDLVRWQGNSGGGIFLPGGNAGSASVPALDLGNNRLISWYDHNGAKTLGGYVYVDANDSLVFGAGNVTRMWLDKLGHLGIGQANPNASALLDLSSITLGFLPPRMTTGQRNAIGSPADGLMVEDVTGKPSFRVSGVWETYPGLPIDLSTTNVTGILPLAKEGAPTGSGFSHVTGGVWDAAARNPVLASSDFSNQGTTTTILHGNGSGSPSWGAVDLATAQVTGNLGISHFNSGTGANASTYWRGDGQWVTNTGGGTNGGTVTSVAMTVPAFLSVSGSPITGAGTLAVTLSGTKLPLANESSPTGTGFATATAGAWDVATRNPVLASADFLNQGTTTTLLHGNAAGSPSFGLVNLANEVTGNLDVSHLNSGTSASVGTFWQGNGTWASPIATGAIFTNLYPTKTITGDYALLDTDYIVIFNGTAGPICTFPTAVGRTGRTYIIKSDTLAPAAVLTPALGSGQTIELSATYPQTHQNESDTVVSDGANWKIVSQYLGP